MLERKDLSPEQEEAFQYILDFIKSNKRQMLLNGYAGTGKTALIGVLLNHLENQTFLDVICTAPTNEAVRVISKLTGKDFYKTIYSLMGLVLIEEDDNPPILKSTGISRLEKYSVIIIDEASMIQEELYELIQEELRLNSHVRIIYVGDEAQLPPVKDEGRDSKVFEVEDSFKLTEVQRTAKKNPIIKVVTDIRNNLSSQKDVFEKETITNEKGDMGIIFHSDKTEFLNLMYDDFKSENYKNDSAYVRVLAYTNRTIGILNSLIRREIFSGENLPEFVEGDNLIADLPVIDTDENAIIYNVGERLRVLNATIKIDEEHGIKYWRLTVENYEEKNWRRVQRKINVIHKDYVKTYKYSLTKYATEAKTRLREAIKGKKYRVSKRMAWKPYFDFKNQFNWVKYSYGTTIHKAQGSTFKNAYVINADCNILQWNDMERNKLKYVAFTRASHLLRVI